MFSLKKFAKHSAFGANAELWKVRGAGVRRGRQTAGDGVRTGHRRHFAKGAAAAPDGLFDFRFFFPFPRFLSFSHYSFADW